MLQLAAVLRLLPAAPLQQTDVRRRGEKYQASLSAGQEQLTINHNAKRSPGAATAHCCSFQPPRPGVHAVSSRAGELDPTN